MMTPAQEKAAYQQMQSLRNALSHMQSRLSHITYHGEGEIVEVSLEMMLKISRLLDLLDVCFGTFQMRKDSGEISGASRVQ